MSYKHSRVPFNSHNFRYKTSHAEISYVSTQQEEEDDIPLEEVKGSHSTKVGTVFRRPAKPGTPPMLPLFNN